MDMSVKPVMPLVPDRRRRLVVFFFLMFAMFMATLDNQIVSTALPTIVGEFGALERFGWIGSAYLLATSAVMPVYGKLGDLFGRKYVMMAAIVIFTVGSLACGLAWSMDSLIAARVLQGLGGGGIMVSIFSVNADLFEPRERARYQSYSSLVIMASGSVGPILGGTMSDLFGWRSIFLINLPIGILVLAGLVFMLPYRRPERSPKIDYLGAVLLALTISSVVLWADSSQLFGSIFAWQSLSIVVFAAITAYLWVQVERRAPEPIVPLRLFKDSTFPLFMVISLVSGGLGIGMVNYYALFLQTTTGLSPSSAGLFFIAVTGGIVMGSLTAGRLISVTGSYKIFSVISLSIAVMAMLAFSQVHAGTPLPIIAIIMLAQGLGVGLGQQAPIIAVQNSAPKADIGAASGAVSLTRMGGAAIAISIYGAIVSSYLKGVSVDIPGVGKIQELTPKMLSELPAASQSAVANLYAGAFTPLFYAAAATAAIGLVAALALKNVKLPAAAVEKPAASVE
ncbi:EmrB/QacA subfamily drug resistance transporter [Rhizobium skierniewicense]|uniref:EmrB/QacA subfamily drug resistance transporter n=1 Tax=Rhizobium skierniewicense TaxID=984260 RepID=A0A7W6C5B1_9HYPH|nr:MDR family MFS transporter [Rhizobium skierniewicense]MBB3945086.1 EmrB/QacA subfamily drug resistance transporter [Rhizobium skierniewicense]